MSAACCNSRHFAYISSARVTRGDAQFNMTTSRSTDEHHIHIPRSETARVFAHFRATSACCGSQHAGPIMRTMRNRELAYCAMSVMCGAPEHFFSPKRAIAQSRECKLAHCKVAGARGLRE
jgi:hypothetical protein